MRPVQLRNRRTCRAAVAAGEPQDPCSRFERPQDTGWLIKLFTATAHERGRRHTLWLDVVLAGFRAAFLVAKRSGIPSTSISGGRRGETAGQ